MTLFVRKANLDDLTCLLHLEEEIFPDPWGEGAIRAHLSSENTLTLLLEGEEGAVGLALGICLVGEGELYRIAVKKDERRRGYGRFLLKSFLDLLAEKDAPVCFLEVRESNAPALSLYRSFGFSLVGKRKKYYKDPPEDALVLRRG